MRRKYRANPQKPRYEAAALVAHMQLLGVDINPSSLSKLEGQVRIASDIELKAISRILGVPMETLVETSEDIENTPG